MPDRLRLLARIFPVRLWNSCFTINVALRTMKKILYLIAVLALFAPPVVHAQKKEEVQKFGREGMEAQRNKNWPKAISAFRKVVELDPSSQNWENLGIVYRNAGNLGEAIKAFTSAIEADADNVSAYGNRASALIGQRRYDEAIQDCTEVLNRQPDNVNARRTRAYAASSKGDWKMAMDDYSAILESNHNDAEALKGRAYVFKQAKDNDKALEDYTALIKLRPKDGHAYLDRSKVYEAKGDTAKAIADADQAVKLDSKNADAQNWKNYLEAKQKSKESQPPPLPPPPPKTSAPPAQAAPTKHP